MGADIENLYGGKRGNKELQDALLMETSLTVYTAYRFSLSDSHLALSRSVKLLGLDCLSTLMGRGLAQ